MQQVLDDTRTYTVEEFLAAYHGREGRYELVDGKVITMPAETLNHVRVKGRAFIVLRRAVAEAGVAAEVLPDGISFKIAFDRAREPDLCVILDQDLDGASMLVHQPVIAMEVLSPSSRRTDRVEKFAEYFTLASLAHYLVLDPDERTVTHHCRTPSGAITSVLVRGGVLRLDPPGIVIDIAALWPPVR